MTSLKELSEEAIRAHVGGDIDTVKRGIVYAKSGAVTNLELRSSTLHAQVGGGTAEPYSVWATFAAADPTQIAVSYCNCQAGHDGRCKHVAAALWAWQRKFDVDRSLLKRLNAANAAATTSPIVPAASPSSAQSRRTRPLASATSPKKRMRTAADRRPPLRDDQNGDDDDANEENSVSSRPCMMDLSQDVEIRIAGARERDVVAAAAAAAAAAAEDPRPASFFNRAISEFQNHSSSLSTTDAVAAGGAEFTTLESFNEMRREIRQLTLLLRWVRLASNGRIARLEQRIAAMQREMRVKDEQLFRREQPHQATFDDCLSAEAGSEHKAAPPPPQQQQSPPKAQPQQRSRRQAAMASSKQQQNKSKKRENAPRLPEYEESADPLASQW
jgi:uncharacterized Zn finger protein